MRTPADAERDRERLRRRIARGGFYEFVKTLWPLMEPGVPFVDGWHIKLVCDHFQALAEGRIKNLMVNIPPGMSKSSIASVAFPVWDWTFRNPSDRYMFGTFDESLAVRDSEKSRNLVNATPFRMLFGDLCGHEPGTCVHPKCVHAKHDPSRDRSDTLGVWWNAAGGLRFSTTVRSKGLGWHAHKQVVDDPLKAQDVLGSSSADATNALTGVINWYTGTMATRRADPSRFQRAVIMQRLHDNDLSGYLKRTQPDTWTVLTLPMEYDPDRPCVTPFGKDPRTERGELLCPARYSADSVAELKRDMGPILYDTQCQQNATPPGGLVVQDDWLGEHDYSANELELLGAFGAQSWDCAFKDTVKSDDVAGHLWYYLPSDGCFYLTDVVDGQMSFVATLGAVESFAKCFPTVSTRIIEDKANGPAILSVLGQSLGLTACTPLGSKESRLVACTPVLAAHRVKIRRGQPWTEKVRNQLTHFPRALRDDHVDATTQALLWFANQGGESWLRFMGQQVQYHPHNAAHMR